jgi:serine/threonine-protein phosphatase 2A activator
MYKNEVLGKKPIMQHFLTGNLIPFKSDGQENLETMEEDEHGCHTTPGEEDTYPTCCGIRVPSAIAVTALEDRQRLRIPFD